jgi:hypothetical protein
MWGALSDERTDVSFTIAAGPRQRHNDLCKFRCNLIVLYSASKWVAGQSGVKLDTRTA